MAKADDAQPDEQRPKNHGTAQIILDAEARRSDVEQQDKQSERRMMMLVIKLLAGLAALSLLGNVALTVLLLGGTFNLGTHGVSIGQPASPAIPAHQ